jgi:hypothetical protein
MQEFPTSGPEQSKIDYRELLFKLVPGPVESVISQLVAELPYLWLDAYLAMMSRRTNVIQFRYGTFDYIYDDYASLEAIGVVPADAHTEARLVAVFGRSNPQKRKRDDSRLRGWVGPTETIYGNRWDKGHFIAHSIGGAVDQAEVNVFVQRRELNRGRSAEGRRYVQMEKYCKLRPGTFCFSRPIYSDQSARPSFIEYGILLDGPEFWVERFDNR